MLSGSSELSVVIANRVFPPETGATGRMARDLARTLRRNGVNVSVVSVKSPHTKKGKSLGNIPAHPIISRMQGRNVLSATWLWLRFIIKLFMIHKPDILITMTDPPMLIVAGGLVARFRGIRHIHWCHDVYPDLLASTGQRPPRFFYDKLLKLSRWAMRECDKVVVIGRCMGRYLIRNGADPANMVVIPNWANPALYKTQDMREAESWESLDGKPASPVPEKKPISTELRHSQFVHRMRFLYAGTMSSHHMKDMLFGAAEYLQEYYPDIEIAIIGNDEDYADRKGRRGLDNIRIIPHQSESTLRQVMESAAVHLVGMNKKAAGKLLPSKVYSAFAVERPVLFYGTDKCEIAEILSNFNAGITVSSEDAQDLARAMADFREQPELWERCQQGAARAGQALTPRASLEAWIRLLKNM